MSARLIEIDRQLRRPPGIREPRAFPREGTEGGAQSVGELNDLLLEVVRELRDVRLTVERHESMLQHLLQQVEGES